MSLESPPNKTTLVSSNQQIVSVDQAHPNGGTVILQPVAMIIPNSHGVYSPSRLRLKKEISYKEFLARYANQAQGIWICFDKTASAGTIFQKSQFVTAYSLGLDCWYIVEGYRNVDDDLSDK